MTETASPDTTTTLPHPNPAATETTCGSLRDGKTVVMPDESEAIAAAPKPSEPSSPPTNCHLDRAPEVGADAKPSETNGIQPPTPDEDMHTANGSSGSADVPHGDERPAKRRRTREVTPSSGSASPGGSRRTKPISPPWKKILADGPSSFSEGGRRKSGRINSIPLELQAGDKRLSRRAVHVQQPSPPSGPPSVRNATVNGHATRQTSAQQAATSLSPSPGMTRRQSTAAKAVVPSSASKQTPASKQNSRRAAAAEARSTPSRLRHRSPSPFSPSSSSNARPSSAAATRTQPSRASQNKRPQRAASSRRNEIPTRTTPRIRLRTRTLTIPVVHPDQTKMRPKLAASLLEYFEKAVDIPVEEGGLFASEDEPRMTDEMAASEAAIIARIEQETEEGGILTEPRCSAFEPEPAEEPPRQWAHMDHLVKAMANFRRLMGIEQTRHRATAKKLAEACRDAWIRRQPKSAEQLEAEARAMWIGRYRLVMRAMFGTWENVRAEINRKRVEEWEAEEQRRVKVALQEAVAMSELKLQARRVQQDSEALSGGEGIEDDRDNSLTESDVDESESDGSADEDESNMSSSGDDDGEEEKGANTKANDDEGLTQEQLQLKYANLPDLEPAKQDGDDTSDESVDMDDDLGSTDMDSDDDDDDADGSDGDDETSDDEDEQTSGLLGMLFGKSELKKLKSDVAVKQEKGEDGAGDVDTKMTDADAGLSVLELFADDNDEVSMIELPGDIDDKQMVPDVEVTAAEVEDDTVEDKTEDNVPESKADDDKGVASPETDAVTMAVSPGRSQSPRTSDTKPSDVDTPTSVDLLGVPKETSASRSVSPVPTSSSVPKTEIPFLLRGTLREYQHYGLDWLAGLYANNTNGILADEMGLGKTIQTIALLAHLACQHEVWGPHLVIVPTSVILNWEMEFKKWCPAFKILTYYGSQDERKRKRTGWTNDDVWNVCITSYQIVVQDQQVFKRRRWHYMILDEAHNIKNFKSQRWQSLLGFNTHSRLLLTGTPLQNNLTELWSLLFFLMPPENGEGGFADLHEFHDWFHKPESQILESGREQMDDEARAIIAKLHKVLRPYLLRRLKADVEKQMPAKYEHVELCRLSKRQRELYDGFLARSDTRTTLSSGNYLSIINCLMQLRKVCNHPDLFVDRPIMTSFRMQRSVAAEYETTTAQVVRQRLRLSKSGSGSGMWADGGVSLRFLNLVPVEQEWRLSAMTAARISQLATNRVLSELKEAQRARLPQPYPELDASTVQSNLASLENAVRWRRFEELQHCAYVNALRRQQRPIYGQGLIDMLTLRLETRPFRARPRVPAKIMTWFENESYLLHNLVQPLGRRSEALEMTISKFACVTPAVVTRDMNEVVLGRAGVQAFAACDLRLSAPIKTLPFMERQAPRDPWHEARMRLTIQFPDKRLLQYDCGKLQALDRLLRRLQAGGHRALIFTQMTKVLDILEQFLNIHGHKYLRLDGATKIEQRQILTDRFNHDSRILCFILSTRSGGLGINLTGADTVIFYDQDWNPAMDKQCQDRCHRIGQTRDVHIYRLVSEHTIEANILRKASQKQMLDDVVIQEGGFTTDYFNKITVQDVLGEGDEKDKKMADVGAGNAAANAAMDRLLGGVETADRLTAGRVLEQAEDTEDVAAARLAEREILQDDADFSEKPGGAVGGSVAAATAAATATGGSTPAVASVVSVASIQGTPREEAGAPGEQNALGQQMHSIDDYMLGWMAEQLQGTALDLPKDRKKGRKKKGKDTRKR
ncbi:helicase swr1 [Grosmannia clavigera kw1407]|uniref:DNA helicase n=1 Tax=Grosmannia clavigera (strain kw1407 / UAMH 11150) TaxID=655863 RepID=F0XQN9_GROCL|nr:helicase swr1 [Grosmannia clavigera kw1407]EFW99983.1 helicase swr1 [Grosmannia clavigera kw1407]